MDHVELTFLALSDYSLVLLFIIVTKVSYYFKVNELYMKIVRWSSFSCTIYVSYRLSNLISVYIFQSLLLNIICCLTIIQIIYLSMASTYKNKFYRLVKKLLQLCNGGMIYWFCMLYWRRYYFNLNVFFYNQYLNNIIIDYCTLACLRYMAKKIIFILKHERKIIFAFRYMMTYIHNIYIYYAIMVLLQYDELITLDKQYVFNDVVVWSHN